MRTLLVWMLVAPFMTSAALGLMPFTSWKNPNITSSKDDRISIASAALEKVVSMLQLNGQFNDTTYETAGRLYAQMAEFDRLTNQTKYKQTLKQCFALAESLSPDFLNRLVEYGLVYGYAAARAYAIYQDEDFLDLAVTSWASARRYTLSEQQAASGTTDVKQFNLSSSCQGATVAGGTYYSTDANDTALHSMASDFFLVVSALLAEATSNQTYLDAAIESANFIHSQLLNPSNVVLDFISSRSNDSCAIFPGVDVPSVGIFIEGSITLAYITHNVSTEALLRSTVVDAATDTLWQGLDGIISTMSPGGHYIVRALAALYERNTTSSDLREYIKEYIGVQYNAVITQATSGGSNIYGIAWTGPPSSLFSGDNQTVALTPLLSAMQLADEQASSKSSDNPTSSAIPSSSTSTYPLPTKKSPTGAIVGGAIGGLAVVAAIIAGILLLRRRHRQWNNTPLVVNGRSSRILTPFMATSVEHHTNRSSSRTVGKDAVGRRMDAQVESTTPLGAHASLPKPLLTERREDTRMEELLRLLHERLQPGRWNVSEDELPPEYHEGRAM